MPSSTLDVAFYALLSIILESLAFGIFLALCLKGVIVLVTNKPRRPRAMSGMVISFTLFQLFVITASWIMDLSRTFDAFIYGDQSPVYVVSVLSDVSGAKATIFAALTTVLTVVFEFFFIYRMYIIWDRRYWICVLPVITTIVSTTASSVNIAWVSLSSQGRYDPVALITIQLTVFFGLSTNLFCSGMITYRIWKDEKILKAAQIHRISSINIMETVRIIVESAALFVVIGTSGFVSYLLDAPIGSVFEALFPSVIGVSFCLVIIRVNGQINRTSSLRWDPQTDSILDNNNSNNNNNNTHQQTRSSPLVTEVDSGKGINQLKDIKMKTIKSHGKQKSHSIQLPELLPGL